MSEPLGMVNSGIELRLLLRSGNARVELLQSRPSGFARVFRGLEPDDLLTRLPLFFSICKQAQTAASAAALMAVQEDGLPATALKRHNVRVAVETLFEAVRALSLTWPGAFGIPPDSEIAEVHSKGANLLAALSNEGDDDRVVPMMADYAGTCRNVIFGAGSDLPQDIDDMWAWAGRRETAAACFFDRVLSRKWGGLGLAHLDFVENAELQPLVERLTGSDGEAFAGRPELDESAAETGALARCRNHQLVESTLSLFGQGLIARLAARLAEAGRVIGSFSRGIPEVMPGQDALRAMAAPNGWGAGIVHSARGMLIHALRLDGRKVADFRILAPTEWNFHPEGAVVRALQSLGRDEGFGRVRNQQKLALLVAAAYDPCVHCNIFVQRAEAGHA